MVVRHRGQIRIAMRCPVCISAVILGPRESMFRSGRVRMLKRRAWTVVTFMAGRTSRRRREHQALWGNLLGPRLDAANQQ